MRLRIRQTPSPTANPDAALLVAGDVVSDTGWFGTKDNTPVELYVNDTRAMRFEYAEVDVTPALPAATCRSSSRILASCRAIRFSSRGLTTIEVPA